ncbi:unnamed protein product, partial [Coregonus sp. 'balchen']
MMRTDQPVRADMCTGGVLRGCETPSWPPAQTSLWFRTPRNPARKAWRSHLWREGK